MTYREIKAQMTLKGVKSVDIARAAGVKAQTVSTVLTGRERSKRIESAIAYALDMPVDKLWPACTRRSAKLPAILGVCRICGCTENRACILPAKGNKPTRPCGWADETETLCTNPKCLAAAKKETALAKAPPSCGPIRSWLKRLAYKLWRAL